MGIKFEGEPPFDLGVAQTVSAQVLDATVVLRLTVVVPERRSKPVPVRFTMSRAIWDRCDNGRASQATAAVFLIAPPSDQRRRAAGYF